MAGKTRLLFVCSANQQRSPTAERLFQGSNYYEARSCGTHTLSRTPCDKALIAWADVIFCMEEHHRQALLQRHEVAGEKKIIVLDIPDMYLRNDPRLIMRLRRDLETYLEHPLPDY